MICQCCHDAPATVERGRGAHRIRLCYRCLSRSGLHHLGDWSLLPQDSFVDLKCPECGLTGYEFSLEGRLGCPHCRETFATALEALMHAAARAIGAVGGKGERMPQEVDLSLALLLEDYELAARIRDELASRGSPPDTEP